jgi:hypothetical protein
MTARYSRLAHAPQDHLPVDGPRLQLAAAAGDEGQVYTFGFRRPRGMMVPIFSHLEREGGRSMSDLIPAPPAVR